MNANFLGFHMKNSIKTIEPINRPSLREIIFSFMMIMMMISKLIKMPSLTRAKAVFFNDKLDFNMKIYFIYSTINR